MKPLASILLPTFLLAACATTTNPGSTPESRFKEADSNGDGVVSREEATNLMIGEAFSMFDSNGDGFVDQTEFVAHDRLQPGETRLSTDLQSLLRRSVVDIEGLQCEESAHSVPAATMHHDRTIGSFESRSQSSRMLLVESIRPRYR